MSERIHVCSMAALEDTDRLITTINGVEIGVIVVDDELFAISNTCAHQHGPVCEGAIKRNLTAEFVGPGKRVNEQYSDTPTIACPLHGWEYDLETGEHVGDRQVSIPTYDVVVEDGEVYFEV